MLSQPAPSIRSISNRVFFLCSFPPVPSAFTNTVDFHTCTQWSNEINCVNFSDDFSCFHYRRRSLTTNRFKFMSISQYTHFHCKNQFNWHWTTNENQAKQYFSRWMKIFPRFFFRSCLVVVGCQWIQSIEMSLGILFTPLWTYKARASFHFIFPHKRHLHGEQRKYRIEWFLVCFDLFSQWNFPDLSEIPCACVEPYIRHWWTILAGEKHSTQDQNKKYLRIIVYHPTLDASFHRAFLLHAEWLSCITVPNEGCIDVESEQVVEWNSLSAYNSRSISLCCLVALNHSACMWKFVKTKSEVTKLSVTTGCVTE